MHIYNLHNCYLYAWLFDKIHSISYDIRYVQNLLSLDTNPK